jgi:hypothetical protein
MKLGDSFLTKGRTKVTLVAYSSNESHPLVFLDERGELHQYTRDGFYISNQHPSNMDIIYEEKN